MLTRESAQDAERAKNLTVLCLGEVGTGKSTFAATFPGPILVYNFDNKKIAYIDAEEKEIELLNFSPEASSWIDLTKTQPEIKKEVIAGKWNTIIVDSITALQKVALERAMVLDPKRDKDGGPIWNVHYAMRKNMVEGFLRSIHALSEYCNVVMIGHYAEQRDKKNNLLGMQPAIAGSLCTEIPAMFEEVYLHNYTVKNNKVTYHVRTSPYGMFKAVRSAIRKNTNEPLAETSYKAINS